MPCLLVFCLILRPFSSFPFRSPIVDYTELKFHSDCVVYAVAVVDVPAAAAAGASRVVSV